MDVAVANDPDRHRYLVTADGEPAGFTEYRSRPGVIAFVHTEVDDRMQGHGIASRLIAAALDDARAQDLAVLPFCPFVDDFIKHHEEYQDLVPADQRAAFGLA